MRRELVEANRLLDDVLTLAQTDARHNGVRMLLEPAPQAPQVQADAVQIQQVILNLVRNSIDAMLEVPEARREIVLRTLVDSEGDVEFMVADRGIGVDADDDGGAVQSVLHDQARRHRPRPVDQPLDRARARRQAVVQRQSGRRRALLFHVAGSSGVSRELSNEGTLPTTRGRPSSSSTTMRRCATR